MTISAEKEQTLARLRLRKIIADAGLLRPYEPGGQRPPRTKRIAKKCIRDWADGGWKSGKWFLESFERVGSWSSAWLPVGPFNRNGNIRVPRRWSGERREDYGKRVNAFVARRWPSQGSQGSPSP